jgi:hypothetical protein
MQALAVSRHVQHKTLVCQRRGLLLLTGAASVFFLGGARTLPAAARPAAFELLQRQQRAMASGGARAAAMPHAEGSLVVDGQAVPWRVELPSGARQEFPPPAKVDRLYLSRARQQYRCDSNPAAAPWSCAPTPSSARPPCCFIASCKPARC